MRADAWPIVVAEIPKNTRERVRVALNEFKGHRLVDVRVTAELGQAGVFSPTGKGISLSLDKLPDLIAALTAAHDRARGEGLL